MQSDLPHRTQDLYDKLKFFPEASYRNGVVTLKPDASVAFLDLRQLLEREIIPALEELQQLQEAGDQG